MNKPTTLACVWLCLLLGAPAMAGEPMTLAQALRIVLAQHPDIELARVDTAIARTEIQRTKGLLDPSYSATITASDEQVPVASDFQPSEKRIASLAGSVSKPLANGGTLSADINYSRTSQGFVSPLASQLAKFNPEYQNQVDISYRHPLLRGAGRPDYRESLTAARADTRAAEIKQRSIAHVLSLKVLNAYYQLAGDDIRVELARQAVARARKLLAYQRSREHFGLIEQADRLQAEALLAARQTELQQAIAQRKASAATLNRLMLRRPDAPIDLPAADIRVVPETPDIRKATRQAELQRPELQALAAELKAAEARLTAARDVGRMQLDAVAKLGTRSLDSSASLAAARGLSISERFASLSLEMSDTVRNRRVKADIRKAELTRQRLIAERAQVLEQIRDELASAITAINAGRPTLKLARREARAEKRKFDAEMRRYREGRSDTATLVQFEGDLRSAELRAELQYLSLLLAERQLAWARGSLLQELGLKMAGGDGQ